MIALVRPGGTLASTVCALFAATPQEVRAEARLEASGFVGVASFADDSELGNSWAPEQVPNTAPVIGARVGWVSRVAPQVRLGVEGEMTFATSFTAGGSGRMSYFAPVFGWRAHGIARLGAWARVVPHVVAGVGGATVASSSPFMSKETDPVFYYGAGVAVPIAGAWSLRVDARHGLMPSRAETGGPSSTLELQLGMATAFGGRAKAAARPVMAPEPHGPEPDGDGDGIADFRDQCPREQETRNGIADDDGCPEQDVDMDGIVGEADRCPDQAEDFDMFEDTDGCPDLDNDGDTVEDARDVCPNQAETKNGFEDADGCPDEVPAEIAKSLAAGSKIAFAAGSARVTPQTAALLAKLLAALRERPELRLVVVGRGDADLAKRRAEAVKWHLVDQGIAQDRISTTIGPAAASPVELTLGQQ
jgi:OOP family OmpA-OmpF porin